MITNLQINKTPISLEPEDLVGHIVELSTGRIGLIVKCSGAILETLSNKRIRYCFVSFSDKIPNITWYSFDNNTSAVSITRVITKLNVEII